MLMHHSVTSKLLCVAKRIQCSTNVIGCEISYHLLSPTTQGKDSDGIRSRAWIMTTRTRKLLWGVAIRDI